MLTIFAQHLATIGNSIKIKENAVEPRTVKRAPQYIEHNFDKRLSEIAYEVGFESLTQFNRSFKSSPAKHPPNTEKPPKQSPHSSDLVPNSKSPFTPFVLIKPNILIVMTD